MGRARRDCHQRPGVAGQDCCYLTAAWPGSASLSATKGAEDIDAAVERHHEHHLVTFAVAVGDGFAKVAHRTGYVAVACPQLRPDREHVPKYRAARARPGERD